MRQDGLADSATHLSGGPLREGNGDQLADFRPLAQVGQVALRQNVRLATAGPRGQQNGNLAREDGLALLVGESRRTQGRSRRRGSYPLHVRHLGGKGRVHNTSPWRPGQQYLARGLDTFDSILLRG